MDAPPDLVIEDVSALLHDDDGAVVLAEHRTVVVSGGAVVAVLDATSPDVPVGGERVRGSGLLAMPGLINCHTHSPMVMFRGAAEDVPTDRWFNDLVWPMEVNLTDDDVELAAYLAAAEMIRGGVTTFADHYFAMDRIATVVEATGLRANLGLTYFSSQGQEGLERSLDFARSRAGTAGGRITTSLAPHATYTVGEPDLEQAAAAALEHDLMVHVHAAESRQQTVATRDATGVTPVEVLRRTGVLEARTLIAHGIGIVPEDLPTLGAVADHVGVASAPKGYLKQYRETTPVRALHAVGVPVGLATDGAASNNTLDVWEAMTYTALVQKSVEGDPTWLTARQALRMATTDSARALGMAGEVGTLRPGARADIVLVDLSHPRNQPVHDLAGTLVLSARSDDVVTTIVDGRVLMRDRRLLTVDVPAVLAELGPRLARLTDRSHGRRIQDYDT